MSDVKNQGLKLKLSLKKETLRVLDDSQLDLLDEVVGGVADCSSCSCGSTGCGTTAKEVEVSA